MIGELFASRLRPNLVQYLEASALMHTFKRQLIPCDTIWQLQERFAKTVTIMKHCCI